jgi:competence protein ComEA
MGGTSTALSAAAGPARWAAITVLGAACIGGLLWSLGREGRPIPAVVVKQTLTEPTRPLAAPAPAMREQQRTEAPGLVPEPAQSAEPPGPVVPPAPQLPTPALASEPSPAAAPTPEAEPIVLLEDIVPPPEPSPAPAAAPSIAKKININTATAAELELLPRIGPAMAQRILDHRAARGPFRSINDLDKVKGIGPKTLEKLRPLVTVK